MKIRVQNLRNLIKESLSENDIKALEDRLLDDPNDTDAWAVYSDYLMDQGDGRGEVVQAHNRYVREKTPNSFARFRSALGNYRKSDTKVKTLNSGERRLSLYDNAVFHREIRLSADSLLKKRLSMLLDDDRTRLVRELHLKDSSSPDAVYEVICSPMLSRFRVLTVSNAYVGPKLAFALAESSHVPQLQEINIWTDNIGDRGLEQMSQRTWPNLTSLTLSQCNVTDDGVRSLLRNQRNFPKLRNLNLTHNSISQEVLTDLTSQLPDVEVKSGQTGWED